MKYLVRQERITVFRNEGGIVLTKSNCISYLIQVVVEILPYYVKIKIVN
jgi:hypothetical protein